MAKICHHGSVAKRTIFYLFIFEICFFEKEEECEEHKACVFVDSLVSTCDQKQPFFQKSGESCFEVLKSEVFLRDSAFVLGAYLPLHSLNTYILGIVGENSTAIQCTGKLKKKMKERLPQRARKIKNKIEKSLLFFLFFFHSTENMDNIIAGLLNNNQDTVQQWFIVAQQIIGYSPYTTMLLKFISHFGIDPELCIQLWRCVVQNVILQGVQGYEKKHFLWGLLLMKVYGTEIVLASMCQTSAKTFRFWSKFTISQIAALRVTVVSKN